MDTSSVCTYCLPGVAPVLEDLRVDNSIFVMTKNNTYICNECKDAFDMCGAIIEIHAMKVSMDPSKSQGLTFGECKKLLRQNKDQPSQNIPRSFENH